MAKTVIDRPELQRTYFKATLDTYIEFQFFKTVSYECAVILLLISFRQSDARQMLEPWLLFYFILSTADCTDSVCQNILSFNSQCVTLFGRPPPLDDQLVRVAPDRLLLAGEMVQVSQ